MHGWLRLTDVPAFWTVAATLRREVDNPPILGHVMFHSDRSLGRKDTALFSGLDEVSRFWARQGRNDVPDRCMTLSSLTCTADGARSPRAFSFVPRKGARHHREAAQFRSRIREFCYTTITVSKRTLDHPRVIMGA